MTFLRRRDSMAARRFCSSLLTLAAETSCSSADLRLLFCPEEAVAVALTAWLPPLMFAESLFIAAAAAATKLFIVVDSSCFMGEGMRYKLLAQTRRSGRGRTWTWFQRGGAWCMRGGARLGATKQGRGNKATWR
jgi:hypothetical protein